MQRPVICLVTPALADANNGNWQTARRWSQLLEDHYEVQLTDAWRGGTPADLMIALHARRSAPSIARFGQEAPDKPLVVVLTGTDLYRDIHSDGEAQASLQGATRLIVLHEGAVDDLPVPFRAKTRVCFQSTHSVAPLAKSSRFLRAVMVGHLRAEKDPRTCFGAAWQLQARGDIRIDHIGAALDATLGEEAQRLSDALADYRWLGPLPHAATRRHIQRAHVLVHPSRMEGGAHVLMEAVCSGTPVLASRIAGNVGMLGAGYGGYFEPGDPVGLATLLKRCRDEPAILAQFTHQCSLRAPLFTPERERSTLLAILSDLLETKST